MVSTGTPHVQLGARCAYLHVSDILSAHSTYRSGGNVETTSVTEPHGSDEGTDDGTLVRAARADPRAFDQLYDRYAARIYAYIRSRVGDQDEAADLTQQVFLRALDGLAGYDERKAPFAAWLFAIARNASIDAHRRRRGAAPWDASLGPQERTGQDDPEAAALHRESLARLWAMLTELGPEKRELVWLRFVSDLSVPEIAAVVGKSPAAVRKQIERTLRALEVHYRER